MILRGIDFGPVFDASGVRGFFGDGYDFHELWKPFGLDFRGSTFVAKTTTLEPRVGNMPADANGDPIEDFPNCIAINPFAGVVLNAVGLSGPGAQALFETGRWQKRKTPFLLSFMAVGETKSDRKTEVFEFLRMLKRFLPEFEAPIGLQINFSCPNVGSHLNVYETDFFGEVAACLADAHGYAGLPVMPKFNILTPIETVREIAKFSFCDAVCVSNTIPWGKLGEHIDWPSLFPLSFGMSPLEKRGYGKGGLSGAPLLPLVSEWVKGARKAGIKKPILAGGGILRQDDAREFFSAGADAVSIGSVAMLRPWRVKKIIEYTYLLAVQNRR